MYNRYIPQSDGSYRRNTVSEPRKPQPARQEPCPPVPEPPCKPPQPQHPLLFLKNLLPRGFDTGDLIVLLLLLLMAGDCAEDQNTAMLTLVLYLFL